MNSGSSHKIINSCAYPGNRRNVAAGSMLHRQVQQYQRNSAAEAHCMGPGVRIRPALKTAAAAAPKSAMPARRAMFPNGGSKTSEYSHGTVKAKSSRSARARVRMALEPLRVNQARVDADTGGRLHDRFHGAVPEVLRRRIGHEEDVALADW